MIPASVLWGLANHIWQSTVMAACVWLLTLALRKNSARLRHCLWLIASAKFLIPLSILIALGTYLRPVAPTVAANQQEVSLVLRQITIPFSVDSTNLETAQKPTAVEHSTGTWILTKEAEWLPIGLMSLWFFGFVTFLVCWGTRWRKIQGAVDIAVPVEVIQNVRVFSSRTLLEPGVFGIFKSKLVLPEGVRERLSEEQLRAVLAHELVHLRWRDNLSAAFHMFVQSVFWFHPALWWIGHRLIEERELACDEAVVRAGNEPEAYAQGILNVCRSYLEAPLACVSGVTGADLKKRVVRIVSNQMSHKLDLSRRVLLFAAALLALGTPVMLGLLHVVQANAQSARANSPTDLTGTWQGTLNAGGHDLRIVIKIDKAAKGWEAKLYSIDQGGQPVSATSVSLQGEDIKIDVLRLGGNYQGKMSPDGSSMTGTWTQGQSMPLVLKRVGPDQAWAIPEPPPPMKAMAADAKPEFEVATIKPSQPDKPGKGFMVRGRKFSTLNTTLEDLMTFSYRINPHQVEGLPTWAKSTKYDLEAQPDGEGMPSDQQWRKMIQQLIADRFKLSYHPEKKDLSVYAIEVAKDGPKMTPDKDNPNSLPMLQFRGLGDLVVANGDMAHLAEVLQGAVLDRPVIDQTGLTGKYDFTLKWTPDPTQFPNMGMRRPPPSTAPDAPPDLFAAMQQQLGLKLESTKAPVTVFVVDHVQQPTAN